jgi:hypothetical protein
MVTYSEHIVTDQTDFDSEIHLYSFNYSIDQFVHMIENALVWRRWRTPYIHCIHLFDRSISDLFILFIYSIDQKKVFSES